MWARGCEYSDVTDTLSIPFEHGGAVGTVDVDYRAGRDVDEIGFAGVAVGFDAERFVGFPVVEAHLSYEGTGYRRLFGWLQLIIRDADDGSGRDVSVDTTPALADIDFPLAAYGYLPTWYDAPANPDHPDGTWTAETFLVVVPVRERVVSMITGFRWGYRLRSGRPSLLPVEPIEPSAWTAHLGLLATRYPIWRFS